MQTTTHDLCSTLNHLLQVCRDGQDGFETAADAVNDPSLQAELKQYSMQREDFAEELKSAMHTLGESSTAHGSATAALHRGWINLQAAIAGNDPSAILAECERGEDAAIRAYRQAIAAGLTPSIALLVESQYEYIDRVHDRIKTLCDKAAH